MTLFDLGARYEIDLNKQLLTLRLNVENLTDKAYWLTSAGSSSIAQGAPRTIKLGAQLDFWYLKTPVVLAAGISAYYISRDTR